MTNNNFFVKFFLYTNVRVLQTKLLLIILDLDLKYLFYNG